MEVLICPQSILWCSLEAPRQGLSNEYPHHMFCGEIRKILSLLFRAMYNKEKRFGTGKK